jgi:MFS family permease
LTGSVPPYIYGDIGGIDRWIWFVRTTESFFWPSLTSQVLGNLLALAGVCPFVGSLSDLIGRRYAALLGGVLLCIGTVVATTAKTMNTFIGKALDLGFDRTNKHAGGTTIAGAGAGICELTALAVTSELAPTRKRGKYVAILIFTILPFVPSGLYAQLIAAHAGWRYIGIIICTWCGIGTICTAVFYFPPPRPNSKGKTSSEIIKEIDFLGGFLSIGGMVLFMAGLQWGGYQYAWSSAHVLAPLLIGVAMLVAFGLWEVYGAKYPMFPSRLKQDPRILSLTLVITFISGANFFSYLMFWPTQAFNVYGHDPVQVGLRVLPGGLAILTGACVVLWLLSVFRGRNKELMIISSILMTAGKSTLWLEASR